MKEFHRGDFANRTGLAQAWTVKSADRLFTFFHSANLSDNKKGIEIHILLQRLSNDDYFLEIKRFCHIVFSMFLFVGFFPIKIGMIFCLDAFAQRL